MLSCLGADAEACDQPPVEEIEGWEELGGKEDLQGEELVFGGLRDIVKWIGGGGG